VADTLQALQQLAASYRKQSKVKVIGITGSNGKTTTKDMVAAIASQQYVVHKTGGNFNNHIGLPLTILAMPENCQVLVLEMGMSGFGEIEQLSLIGQPDAAIVTIIGESHLEQLGSRAGIAQAKMEITAGLAPGGLLVVPGDEPLIQEIVAAGRLDEKFDLVRFGDGEGVDITLTGVMTQPDATSFGVNVTNEVFTVPMAGEHNARNALTAIAVGYWLDIPVQAIKWGLRNMVPTGMRMEITKLDSGLTIVNDAYNASPTSMRAALNWFGSLGGYRRKIAVLGDMLELGPDSAQLHSAIGDQLTPATADAILTYGPQASLIADAARPHFPDGNVVAFDNQEALATLLLTITSNQDIVLLKGSRGMKLEQLIPLLQMNGGDTTTWN
jgi:UDP-N-acetylmuramoyl-tripeptide--D-alanyl-D-alanine ligase